VKTLKFHCSREPKHELKWCKLWVLTTKLGGEAVKEIAEELYDYDETAKSFLLRWREFFCI